MVAKLIKLLILDILPDFRYTAILINQVLVRLLCSIEFSLPVTTDTKDPSSLLLTWQILLDWMDGAEQRGSMRASRCILLRFRPHSIPQRQAQIRVHI